jgi:endonuclease YncB( thermonuclease family)
LSLCSVGPWGLLVVVVSAASFIPLYAAEPVCSDCRYWHSCPSLGEKYVCGDRGDCTYCPDNQYCKDGQVRSDITRGSKKTGTAQTSFPHVLYGEVMNVITGDTIYVVDQHKNYRRVQCAGITAPECDQPHGIASREHLCSFVCSEHVTVRFSRFDKLGRVVGKILINERDICLEQIEAGFAWHYDVDERAQLAQDREHYAQAEQRARNEKRGLWQDENPVSPWQFRKWLREDRVPSVQAEDRLERGSEEKRQEMATSTTGERKSLVSQIRSPLDQFALDGLDSGELLMGGSLDVVVAVFGLPDRIEVQKAEAFWDVDLEETPANWIYPGFIITTHYYRDGLPKKGVKHLVPGPYHESREVMGMQVNGRNVAVRFGLGVGAPREIVIQKLGQPDIGRYSPSGPLVYIARTRWVDRKVRVTFNLDAQGRVSQITWSREPWH